MIHKWCKNCPTLLISRYHSSSTLPPLFLWTTDMTFVTLLYIHLCLFLTRVRHLPQFCFFQWFLYASFLRLSLFVDYLALRVQIVKALCFQIIMSWMQFFCDIRYFFTLATTSPYSTWIRSHMPQSVFNLACLFVRSFVTTYGNITDK